MRKSDRTLNAAWSDQLPVVDGKRTHEPLDEAEAPLESNQMIIQHILEGREREMKPSKIVNEIIALLAQWTLTGYANTVPSTLHIIQLALYGVVRTFLRRPLPVLQDLRDRMENTPIEEELKIFKDDLKPLDELQRDLSVLIIKARDEGAPRLSKKLEDLSVAVKRHPLVLLVCGRFSYAFFRLVIDVCSIITRLALRRARFIGAAL